MSFSQHYVPKSLNEHFVFNSKLYLYTSVYIWFFPEDPYLVIDSFTQSKNSSRAWYTARHRDVEVHGALGLAVREDSCTVTARPSSRRVRAGIQSMEPADSLYFSPKPNPTTSLFSNITCSYQRVEKQWTFVERQALGMVFKMPVWTSEVPRFKSWHQFKAQFPVSRYPGKWKMMAQRLEILPPTWKNLIEFPAPSFSLFYSGYCRFGKWTNRWKTALVYILSLVSTCSVCFPSK